MSECRAQIDLLKKEKEEAESRQVAFNTFLPFVEFIKRDFCCVKIPYSKVIPRNWLFRCLGVDCIYEKDYTTIQCGVNNVDPKNIYDTPSLKIFLGDKILTFNIHYDTKICILSRNDERFSVEDYEAFYSQLLRSLKYYINTFTLKSSRSGSDI